MTISAVVPDIAFAGSSGSGTMGPFSLVKSGTPLVFFNNSEVVVLRYDSVTDTTPTLLIEGTDYTLTGGPSAGSITLTAPQTGLLTAERLYVTTLSALAQSLDLVNGGNFSSANLERRLDIIFQILQQHDREIKSTIRFAMFDTDEIPKTTPLGAVIDKVPYITSTTSAPTVAYLDALVLNDLSELGDANLANIALVAADLAGADTIGIVAAVASEIETLAPYAADIGTVSTAIDDGTIADLLDGQVGKIGTYADLTAIPASGRSDGKVVYVASHSADGDGGEGFWRFEAGSVETPNGGTILAPDAGTGRWLRQYEGAQALSQWFGAQGDGAANDTAGLTALFAAGGRIYIPPGEYLTDPIAITSRIHLTMHRDAVIKLRAPMGALQAVLTFAAGSEGSVCETLYVDGNRDALIGSYVNHWRGVLVTAANVTIRSGKFTNHCYWGLMVLADDFTGEDLLFEDCGAAYTIGDPTFVSGGELIAVHRPRIGRAHCVRIDNRGLNFSQHAVDWWHNVGGHYGPHTCEDQDGDTGGTSTFVSGFTSVQCQSCTWDLIEHRGMLSDVLIHVPITHVAPNNCHFGVQRAYDFAGTGIEVNAWQNCTFDILYADGRYRSTSVRAATVCVGVDINNASFYKHTQRRGLCTSAGVSGGKIVGVRSGIGIFDRGGFTDFYPTAIGNLRQGLLALAPTSPAFFEAAENVLRGPSIYRSPFCVYNGTSNIDLNDTADVMIDGGKCIGAGQDTSQSAAARSGIRCTHAEVANARLQIHGTVIEDGQTWTVTGGISYVPGTTDAKNRYTFTRARNFDVYFGQYIRLVAAGSGGVDVIGKVVDIDLDEIVLEFASATTFIAVTSALSGTFSSSGTTLTGSGTDLGSEAAGPFVLYHAGSGAYRQLIRTTSDTAGQLRSGFPSNLSGATLAKVACEVRGVPSQQHHLSMTGAGLTRISLKGIEWGLDYVVSPVSAAESILDNVTIGSIYPLGVKGVAFTPASNNHPLITGLPRNHRVIGAYARLTANWTDATSLELRHSTSAGANIGVVGAFGGITSGSKVSFQTVVARTFGANNQLNLVSGTNPTAGTANALAWMMAEAVPNALNL